MILITGGLGFIGSHTARALIDLGETCVLTRHRSSDVPPFLRAEVDRRAMIVGLDISDRAAVLALRDRFPITGIVHLGGALSNPIDELRSTSAALANVFEAAMAWKVRTCIASAIGVYAGVMDGGSLREDAVVPLTGYAHPIVAMKKCAEVYAELVAQAGVDCVVLRIGGIYGPRYARRRTFPSRLAPALAHRTQLDLEGVQFGLGPDDGSDWCYVKDCARAIAGLQTARTLRHRVYNVGSGVVTRNRDFVAIGRALVPDANLPVWEDAVAPPRTAALDITRLRDDTGYAPAYTAVSGLADYVAWLRDQPTSSPS